MWHLARIQDAQIAELIDADQLWVSGDWASRFGLEPDPDNHGYGHTPEQVLQVRPESSQALLDYLAAVDERTTAMLAGLTADDLDRVVDRNWDPPVTLGVRLVSVADDGLQHAGQAAYVRGGSTRGSSPADVMVPLSTAVATQGLPTVRDVDRLAGDLVATELEDADGLHPRSAVVADRVLGHPRSPSPRSCRISKARSAGNPAAIPEVDDALEPLSDCGNSSTASSW